MCDFCLSGCSLGAYLSRLCRVLAMAGNLKGGMLEGCGRGFVLMRPGDGVDGLESSGCVGMWVCRYVCMWVCRYVCMCVCRYVCRYASRQASKQAKNYIQ